MGWIQWILIGYAVFSATGLLIVSYWKELAKYVKNSRYIILAVIIAFQAGLFCMLKFYFFKKYNEAVQTPDSKSGNSTLLI